MNETHIIEFIKENPGLFPSIAVLGIFFYAIRVSIPAAVGALTSSLKEQRDSDREERRRDREDVKANVALLVQAQDRMANTIKDNTTQMLSLLTRVLESQHAPSGRYYQDNPQ